MRDYELMLVVRPDFPDDDAKRTALVKKILEGTKATVKEVKLFGKKQLAYPIKKFNEAVYVLATVESDALKVSSIEAQTRLGTDVLRYLLIVKG